MNQTLNFDYKEYKLTLGDANFIFFTDMGSVLKESSNAAFAPTASITATISTVRIFFMIMLFSFALKFFYKTIIK